MSKNNFEPDATETVISSSVQVKGNLVCETDLWVDGTVNGSIEASGSVTLGPNAQIFGDVRAANLNVSGQIKGNVVIEQKLFLAKSAHLIGDIKTASLAVDVGAILEGQVSMPNQTPSNEPAPAVDEPKP
jgi:cytoskeletal protein CcmA (bactofilin family)